jgi:outer membrane protein assembly factor BamB
VLAAGAADWPQFLGPERNGVSAETGLRQTWPSQGPPVLWEKKVGAGLSGPVVAGARLILFHRLADREVVACLDAASGAEHWQFPYPTAYTDDLGVPHDEGPRATPVMADGRVYTLGAEGRLHCLDVETGKKIWGRDVNTDYAVPKAYFGVGTSPLLEGNLLLVNVGGRGAGIVAFDKDTGKEVWKATSHAASYSSPVAATIDGVRSVLFFTREGLVGLDPATGTIRFSKRWRARFDASVNAAVPLVIGDQVFLSASYNTGAVLLRVRPNGLDEVWKSDAVLSNHYNTSVHHEGFLYGLDGRQEQGVRLRCVELKTGTVRWSQEGFGCSSLILVEGNLVCLTEDGDLVLVEATPAAYREKARATVLTKPCRAHLALADGRLYGRDGKRLVCWNLKK